MGFCNSCGRPMGRNDYGTNEDGSPNMDYCKDCFQNGEFTEPDITINEMIIRHAKRMLKRNPDLREEEATGILCNFLPNLKRWNPNPDDEIDEDGEPVMGYRGNAKDMFWLKKVLLKQFIEVFIKVLTSIITIFI